MNLQSRTDIPQLLRDRGLTGWGVEVGAFTGDYSACLLQYSQLSRLFTIDPWHESQPGLGDASPREHYDLCLNKLWPHYPRSVVLRQTSVDAARMFAERSLDFVYIDANHDYGPVSRDIQTWWPKMKPGGIFAGHDYNAISPDVRRAVDEFCAYTKLELHLTECDFLHAETHVIRSWLCEVPHG